MAEVTVTNVVNAPVSEVWASWDDYGNIVRFNPNLKGSHLLLDGKATGLGAKRQCDLADGKNHIREEIVGYTPLREIVVDIYDGTMPLNSAKATIRFDQQGVSRTKVTMTMEFTPKMGLLGKAMIPIMKPMFRKMLNALLVANAAFVERGEEVARAA